MFQWMGGSRQKMRQTERSTKIRQHRYFEGRHNIRESQTLNPGVRRFACKRKLSDTDDQPIDHNEESGLKTNIHSFPMTSTRKSIDIVGLDLLRPKESTPPPDIRRPPSASEEHDIPQGYHRREDRSRVSRTTTEIERLPGTASHSTQPTTEIERLPGPASHSTQPGHREDCSSFLDVLCLGNHQDQDNNLLSIPEPYATFTIRGF